MNLDSFLSFKIFCTRTDYTPLRLACRWGRKEVVEVLVKNNAKIDIKDEDGRTALFFAKLNEEEEIVRLLIEYGADTTVVDNYGYTLDDLNNKKIREKIKNEI